MAASAKGSVSPPLSNSTNSTTEASSQINNTRGTASKRKAIPLSHKGDAIGLMIEKCLLDWGIDKLFTVTVDNATSNDVAIGYLRKRFSPQGGCIANDTAEKFERAFERFEEQDTNFRAELELGEGWPTVNDWTCVRNLRDFLEHFYEVTLRVSDPRQKLSYLEFALSEMYDSEKSFEVMQKLKETLNELYDEYKPRVSSDGNHLNDQTFELDKYLGEAVENYDDEFDILSWWKVNSPRFPVLSNMAKDVLAIPLSTVASESPFSTGGRVLDQFRSSLTPKMVQDFVCTQDYIKKSSIEEEIKKFEEQIQELDKIDNGMLILY
ncbi:hypothetical protein F3Y22_tig00110114pilonHSYRG00365 [Hibiscus syriacus]|uniref:HAT C-terminal dimerisation domain-containing protein n=1 Tax=Hibiscus syriacus TaxID=106335 RepID=A0A6A3BKH4_HIBSY|nr:hypothetical protein F3Y22_tig00110114pilonHSYRG00365 [Hibiscus syriacus]